MTVVVELVEVELEVVDRLVEEIELLVEEILVDEDVEVVVAISLAYSVRP